MEAKHRLSVAVNMIARAMEANDLETILTAKDGFYAALLDGAGNPDLSSMLQLLHVRIRILRRYSLSAAGRHAHSLAEIKAIVAAIVSGDVEAAGRAARHHAAQARNAALPHIFAEQFVAA